MVHEKLTIAKPSDITIDDSFTFPAIDFTITSWDVAGKVLRMKEDVH